MSIQWTHEDARRWAAFSGDYNPIHFERAAAQATGAEDVTVHGMRAMWDLKQRLAGLWRNSTADWLHCGIRLRQPLVVERPYQLSVQAGARGIRGGICHPQTDDWCFKARLEAKRPVFDASSTLHPRELTPSSGETHYPLAKKDWCYVDALLFKFIVDAPESMEIVHRVLPELSAQTLGDLFLQLPVVQTHHDIWFQPPLLTSPVVPTTLQAAMLPSLVMGDRQNGFILQMSAGCIAQGNIVMATAVTLKTWPVASNHQ